MKNTKIRSILIIVIAALLVSILFNIRTFISMYESLAKVEEFAPERVRGIEARFKFAYFNLIIEFIVFGLVAFFNYSWIEKIVDLRKFKQGSIPIIVISNLIIFFILIPD